MPAHLRDVLALACASLAGCSLSIPATDGGTDAPRDAPGAPDIGPIEPCSPSVVRSFALHLCVRMDDEPSAPGFPTDAVDELTPIALHAVGGGDFVVEALVTHRPVYHGGRGPEAAPYVLGARVRHRVRLEGPTPFGALEEAIAILPEESIAEFRRANAETDCAMATGVADSGRLLCASIGDWDLWAHAWRADVGVFRDGLAEPVLNSVVLVNRVERRLYWLRLQGLPDSCEHPPDRLPSEPCRPLLEVGAAYTMFAQRGSSLDLSDLHYPSVDYGCPLELSCNPCCSIPEDSAFPYTCWPRGFYRCDENLPWFDAACAAATLDELVPPPVRPCRTEDDAWLTSICSPYRGGEYEISCF